MAWSLLDVAGFVIALGNVGLGLVIGYQAYRGFRRHQSRSMRYLSMGLILLTAIAASFGFASWIAVELGWVPETLQLPMALVYRVVQFVGLSLIAYSLYIRS